MPPIYTVLATLLLLFIALYATNLKASVLFMGCVLVFLAVDIIELEDFLAGLANKQIVTIFLLVMVSIGLKKWLGDEVLAKIFRRDAPPKAFLLRMMATVGALSAVLNNTPIVAFGIPMVKDWCNDTGQAASKFLMPLAFITTLGGMITVVGTSTNLVLNGLILDNDQTVLQFMDFFVPGILVTLSGGLFLYTVGYKLLPNHASIKNELEENAWDYMVETHIKPGSTNIGQTVESAGFRHLNDAFLVEILRNGTALAPVSPDEVLLENDILFFSGNTTSIYNLIKNNNGLALSDEEAIENRQHFHFAEAVIPVNSTLEGKRVKDADFRDAYDASIIAIRQRQGTRVTEQIGDLVLHNGDLLLLLCGNHRPSNNKDLLFVSNIGWKIKAHPISALSRWGGVAGLLLLVAGIAGVVDLFVAAMLSVMSMHASNLMTYKEIKESIDLDLLILLVASLAIGTAILNSGLGAAISQTLVHFTTGLPPIWGLASLFGVTVLLTSIITNVAAVAMMFPVALTMSEQMGLPTAPFFVVIAFGASCAFLTPVAYQTNLMVMGPGNYTFRDYFRVGLPLTLVYGCVVLSVVALMLGR